jgi:REP-associated tyrosine transposase
MANTYTQIHIQVVFSVQNRQSLIQKDWRNRLYKYITGIIKNNGHKLLQINGTEDHIHILIGLRPNQSLSELIKKVKQDSSLWVNNNRLTNNQFSWQAGYGAFSYAKPDVQNVIRYIQNQEIHHKKKTFIEEYKELLKIFNIDFNEEYIFKSVV